MSASGQRVTVEGLSLRVESRGHSISYSIPNIELPWLHPYIQSRLWTISRAPMTGRDTPPPLTLRAR